MPSAPQLLNKYSLVPLPLGVLVVNLEMEAFVATTAIDKINRPRDLPKIKGAPEIWGGGFWC